MPVSIRALRAYDVRYIGPFSIMTQRRIKKVVHTLCSDLEIKLVVTQFKIKSWFGAKDPIPAGLRSRVIYKFSCAGCSEIGRAHV